MNIITLLAVCCTLELAELRRCPEIELLNGTYKPLKYRPYLSVRFKCNTNFQLVGVPFAICQAGNWNTNLPVCVDTTCPLPELTSGLIAEILYRGGVISLTCAPGLVRFGSQRMMCLAGTWDKPLPVCAPITSMTCDFDHDYLCGWSQDTKDEFDWMWHQGGTPTNTSGPISDRTLNSASGHYLFMESSAPQKCGHKARLLSPVYTAGTVDGLCLEFYYHMFGPDQPGEVGNLDVYINTSSSDTTQHIFHQGGNQGDRWIRAEVYIPPKNTTLQLIFQGTRLKSFASDIAIDDIRIHNCSQSPELTVFSSTSANHTLADKSCNGTLPLKVSIPTSVLREIISPTTHINDTYLGAAGRTTEVIMPTNSPNMEMMSSNKTRADTNSSSHNYPSSDKIQTDINILSHTYPADKIQTDTNILSRIYPSSDKTQRDTIILSHTYPADKTQTDTNILSHTYSTGKTQTDTNILTHTYPSSDKTQTGTNILSHTYPSSDKTQTDTIIFSTNNIIDEDNEIADTGNRYIFETRHTIILNLTILFAVLLAACPLALSWCRRHRDKGRVKQEETQLQIVY